MADAAASVTVSGGTQEGIYVVTTFDKTNIENGDKIAWINAVEINGNATFDSEVLAAMKEIKTVYATSASFKAGTFDMFGKTLVLTGALKTISGAGIQATTVNNITIINAEANDVTLNGIAASGIYSNATGVSAKIKADGLNATWNGAKVE